MGFKPFFQESFAAYDGQGDTIGRIALEHKHLYRVYTENGDLLADVSGKFRFQTNGREDFPAVGDFVVMSVRPEEGKATIHAVLPRKSKFSRKIAGNTTEEQIVASNVDTVFLVNALNNDFNVRRIERYLIMAWESGANPVIILSKADLCDDVEEKVAQVESVAIGVPIHVTSSVMNEGIEELLPYVGEGQTVALLGSSGVGKSTLTNRLVGRDVQLVQEVREGDDRGKHTTTHREMIALPQGGLLIDTPGMRELQLWEADEGFSDSFADVMELAESCRFGDCGHNSEPGCAVKAALHDGSLDKGRYNNFVKMQRELAYLARKDDARAQAAEKQKWKNITKSMRGFSKKTR
ncbi:ribosome small subunit-dependent GTPase A [Tumebacillus sp. BK434]|uniref:ribosome small subunit-dependent GTPase A n=1 Tax=Tumebacillus sp. BK434 TaxID=2512169 RepID=UPI00104591CC|nr:ribosome small subunit-dependent GTPase A [Tumebacillus sp. BK434]